jgi:50S ribosome-binding GTPase
MASSGFLTTSLISLWIDRIHSQKCLSVVSSISQWEQVYQDWISEALPDDFIEWLKLKGYVIPLPSYPPEVHDDDLLDKFLQDTSEVESELIPDSNNNNAGDDTGVIESHSFFSHQGSITLPESSFSPSNEDKTEQYLTNCYSQSDVDKMTEFLKEMCMSPTTEACESFNQDPFDDDDTVSWSQISQDPLGRKDSREDLLKEDESNNKEQEVDFKPQWIRKPRFLVIGNLGVGKSSFIREMLKESKGVCTKSNEIVVGSGLKSVTLTISTFESEDAIWLDTVGLDEPKDKGGRMSSGVALYQILKFMKNSEEGLDMMIFVHRGRVSESFARNYEFFFKIIGKETIPSILVLTGGENSIHFSPSASYEERSRLNKIAQIDLKSYGYHFDHVVNCCFAESCGNPFFEEIYASFARISKKQLYLCLKTYQFEKPIFLWCEVNRWNQLYKIWNFLCDFLGVVPIFSQWHKPLLRAKELFKLDDASFAALVSLFKYK